MKILIHLMTATIIVSTIAACSTRHVDDQYFGSTEQRLVSHSLDTLLTEVPTGALPTLEGKNVYLQSIFVAENPLSHYAHERLSMELKARFKASLTSEQEKADYVINAFFTSIGTNRDSAGISLPLLYVPQDDAKAELPLIAVDMYHGISEIYFYTTDVASGEITKSELFRATTKTDKIATPFFSFPINHLK